MHAFQKSYLVLAVSVSLICCLGLISSLNSLNLLHVLVYAGIIVIAFVSYQRISSQKKWGFGICLFFVNLLWWPLLWLTSRRILFVIENGRLEAADGYGSPVAFLLGVAIEQVVFVPATIGLVLGVSVIIHAKRAKSEAV